MWLTGQFGDDHGDLGEDGVDVATNTSRHRRSGREDREVAVFEAAVPPNPLVAEALELLPEGATALRSTLLARLSVSGSTPETLDVARRRAEEALDQHPPAVGPAHCGGPSPSTVAVWNERAVATPPPRPTRRRPPPDRTPRPTTAGLRRRPALTPRLIQVHVPSGVFVMTTDNNALTRSRRAG